MTLLCENQTIEHILWNRSRQSSTCAGVCPRGGRGHPQKYDQPPSGFEMWDMICLLHCKHDISKKKLEEISSDLTQMSTWNQCLVDCGGQRSKVKVTVISRLYHFCDCDIRDVFKDVFIAVQMSWTQWSTDNIVVVKGQHHCALMTVPSALYLRNTCRDFHDRNLA